MNIDSGCYLYVCSLARDIWIKAGARPNELFSQGYYVYVGRAKKNLLKRLARHFLPDKKLRWHIDYLSTLADPAFALITENLDECLLSRQLEHHGEFKVISGFGASDCRCSGHLYFSCSPLNKKYLVNIFSNLPLRLYTFKRQNSGKP